MRERVALLRRVGLSALRRAGTELAWVLAVDPERHELASELTADLALPGGSVHLASGVGFVPGTDDLEPDEAIAPGHDRFVTLRMDTDDALLPDNTRTIILTVRETIPVLLVNGKLSAERFSRATDFLQIALNPFPTGKEERWLPLRPVVVSPQRFKECFPRLIGRPRTNKFVKRQDANNGGRLVIDLLAHQK